jgi:hypothetical protein
VGEKQSPSEAKAQLNPSEAKAQLNMLLFGLISQNSSFIFLTACRK